MINITKNVSTAKTNYAPSRNIQYIVIHYTAGSTSKKGAAINAANYWATSPREASADFVVDDETIVQYNPDIGNRLTWHCGDLRSYTKGGSLYGKCTNANSIGIEICSTNNNYSSDDPANSPKWSFSAAAIDRAVELTKFLMDKYNVPLARVVRHYDVSGKLCPGIIGWNADSGSEAKWQDFKKRLGADTKKPAKPTAVKTPIYRVRRSASDATTQIGAYAVLSNAKKQADLHTGYSVYDMSGNLVYAPATKKKTTAVIAKEVIAGKWGNGENRKRRLTEAGYDYATVQAEVNRLMG